ncbi:MAG: helix-turn-helix transcriptional regulator [Deltaproteobacteria bacterium]|nr:helix-turn-helix transcriptional regulator [Deltaproteobacteria bacterium]
MVSVPAIFVFPPFQLDVTTRILWKGQQRCQLRSQVAAVLHYLLEHPSQVVSKEELLASLWPGQRVSPGVLKTYIWELRRALRDQQQKPRFIETLPRRGYRFIGAVRRLRSEVSKPQPLTPSPQAEAEAEACFQKALEIAQRQNAKSLELRATMSLARLWQRQGKRAAARKTLAEIYHWFSEGFDTGDLKEASTVLAKLA